MKIPDHLTCLLRNLYAGQEATVRTEHGTADWFQFGKEVHKGWLLSPCLFTLHAEFSSVQSLSHVQLFATPWIAARQASLSFTNSRSSLRLTSIESVMPSRHLILSRPLLLLPRIPPSIKVFSNESTVHIRWPKTGVSALASVLPMNTQDWSPLEWAGWISLQSKGLSRVFSNTTIQKHQFFCAQPSLWFNSHIRTWLLEKW